jgi:hypothetical protein
VSFVKNFQNLFYYFFGIYFTNFYRHRWNKFFRSRLVRAIEAHSHLYAMAGAGILLLLFFGELVWPAVLCVKRAFEGILPN